MVSFEVLQDWILIPFLGNATRRSFTKTLMRICFADILKLCMKAVCVNSIDCFLYFYFLWCYYGKV